MATDPKINIAETPEFKDAVEKVKQESAKAVADALALMRTNVGTSPSAGDTASAESLAMAIASLVDQDSGRTHISPEVLRARANARERMEELLIEVRAKGDVPSYEVTSVVQLDDQLIKPSWIANDHVMRPTEVDWCGVPNEAMRPLNEVARKIYAAFCESIGGAPDHQGIIDANEAAMRGQTPQLNSSGVVVRGANKRRTVQQDVEARQLQEGGVRLRHESESDPTRGKYVRVLGKTMAPARQSV